MNNRVIKIGIAGLGTVGSGVINLLKKNSEEISKRSGFKINDIGRAMFKIFNTKEDEIIISATKK